MGFQELLRRRRKGSLLLVITFGTTMAFVVMGMLVLATNLYAVARSSAEIYADTQSYRAATEIATYQYITDLQAVQVTKDLDGDWVSVSGHAVYTQALQAIQDSLASPEDSLAWHVTDVRQAINGANLDNPLVVTDLLGLLANAKQSFKLVVPEPLVFDWSNPDSWSNRRGANIALKPFRIEATLNVRGETVFETFDVDGLFLTVDIQRQETDAGDRHDIATMRLTEKEEGVIISRAPLTEETPGDNLS